MCCDSLDMNRNDKLKAVLNEYFDSQSLEETGEVPMVTEEPVRPSFFIFFYLPNFFESSWVQRTK